MGGEQGAVSLGLDVSDGRQTWKSCFHFQCTTFLTPEIFSHFNDSIKMYAVYLLLMFFLIIFYSLSSVLRGISAFTYTQTLLYTDYAILSNYVMIHLRSYIISFAIESCASFNL